MDIYPEISQSKKESFKPTRLYIKLHTETDLLYFGKTIKEDISTYHGSGKYWTDHINKHGKDHVITLWISKWYYLEDIEELQKTALDFSRKYDILNATSIFGKKLWANLKEEDGINGGRMCETVQKIATENQLITKSTIEWQTYNAPLRNQKMRDLKNSKEWKETTGKNASRKMSETRLDPEWKETKGKDARRKEIETKSSIEWQETVGKNRSIKTSQTRNSKEWKETKGKDARRKEIETKSDPIWIKTIGEEAKKKLSKTRLDPIWRAENHKTCEYCLKSDISPSNYSRWHGNNCKNNKNSPRFNLSISSTS